MSIFQKSVVQKYIKNLDKLAVTAAYETFQLNYSSEKIEQIKDLKEEEFQDGFLRDIFEDVLGYTLRPNEDYDLHREFKNKSDGKRADGAIVKDKEAIAVIELKSTKTKDLTKITEQAFNYKNNQPKCKYVITSNFQQLRFYIDYSNEFEEFDLFNLDRNRFELLYLILHRDNIFSDVPDRIKEETLFHEEKVSEELYADYSNFKKELYENLIANNLDENHLLLFTKSQKLLDRFLFILFAEDIGLLPPNLTSRLIDRFEVLKREDAYKPVYEIIKQYFGYMNMGLKGESESESIPAYNGGLFYEDPVLDSFQINDALLIRNLLKLSAYDFNTEVDVNILGHIFEHSLNEIESVIAEMQGTISDMSGTKRKKDGVFYTPKYITAYIIDRTVGTFCRNKRKQLGIEEVEFDKEIYKKSGDLTVKGNILFSTLSKYKEWLIELKIVDPACGSGAFLNQALNFLVDEHKKIDNIISELTGSQLYFDVDKKILENNLFGVDINEESVEIAQLSLWLRTARKGRKLSNLSRNIKCGNSLLVTQFDWSQEFPEIMAAGGFDIVIGNPPYIKEYTNREAFNGLHDLDCYQGKMDLWYFFGALALEIVKKDEGLIGYIAPNNWITNSGASKFRNIILNTGRLIEFIDFGDFKVFKSAGIQTMIYVMQRTKENTHYTFAYSKVLDKRIKHTDVQLFLEKKKEPRFVFFPVTIDKVEFIDKPINFVNSEYMLIVEKIRSKQNFKFNKNEIAQGIVAPQDILNKRNQNTLGNKFNIGDGIFNIDDQKIQDLKLSSKEKELLKPFFTSRELQRHFGNPINQLWVIYTDSRFKNPENMNPYPRLKQHLDEFQDVITSSNKPYGLHRARDERFFRGKKIFSLRKCVRPTFTYTDFDCYVSQTYFSIKTSRLNQKYLTGLLNSNLFAFWLKYQGKMQGDLYQVDKGPLMNLPVIEPPLEFQITLGDLVCSILLISQKIIDYSKLLSDAKLENKFDREIMLNNDITKLASDMHDAETRINMLIYSLYDIDSTEVLTIEACLSSSKII